MSLLRILKYVWATPVSLIGLLVALVCGGRDSRWSGEALEFTVDRLWGKFTGFTCGWVILYKTDKPSARLEIHEHVHVRQCLRLGPLVCITYPLASLLAYLAGGHYYKDNVFESVARQAAGQ